VVDNGLAYALLPPGINQSSENIIGKETVIEVMI
jgi:hypothetical protein